MNNHQALQGQIYREKGGSRRWEIYLAQKIKSPAHLTSPPAVDGELREGNKLGERRGEGGRDRRRAAADRAGGVEMEPGVDAREVEGVAAIWQHPQHLRLPVFAEADRADGIAATSSVGLGKGEFWVGADDGLVEAAHDVIVIIIVVGDKDGAGEDDGVRVRISSSSRMRVAVTACIGGEEDSGEEEEEAEGDGNRVAEAKAASTEVVKEMA